MGPGAALTWAQVRGPCCPRGVAAWTGRQGLTADAGQGRTHAQPRGHLPQCAGPFGIWGAASLGRARQGTAWEGARAGPGSPVCSFLCWTSIEETIVEMRILWP